MEKIFLFDCEMGGLTTQTSLLTLYGMILNKKLEVEDTIDLKIKPDNGFYCLSAGAMDVNKIDIVEHDKTAILEHEAALQFYDFVYKHFLGTTKIIPAGHNVFLDIQFVKTHLLKAENTDGNSWDKFFSYRQIDTVTIANALILAGKLPQSLNCSLGSLAEYFGFDYSNAHTACFDAKLTLEVLKKLIELVGEARIY